MAYKCPSCGEQDKLVTYRFNSGDDEGIAVTSKDLKNPEFMLKHIFADVCVCGEGVDDPQSTAGPFSID